MGCETMLVGRRFVAADARRTARALNPRALQYAVVNV